MRSKKQTTKQQRIRARKAIQEFKNVCQKLVSKDGINSISMQIPGHPEITVSKKNPPTGSVKSL